MRPGDQARRPGRDPTKRRRSTTPPPRICGSTPATWTRRIERVRAEGPVPHAGPEEDRAEPEGRPAQAAQGVDSGLAEGPAGVPARAPRCRTFRLTDDEVRSAGGVRLAVRPGRARAGRRSRRAMPAKGKELFETRGCLACHSIGEGAKPHGRRLRRQPLAAGREGQLRLHRPLGSQPAAAHAALLPARSARPRPGGLHPPRPALRVRPGAIHLPQRRPPAAGAEHDRDAEPAPVRRGRARHRHLPDQPQTQRCHLPAALPYMDDPGWRQGPPAGGPVRLRKLPRDQGPGRGAAHRHRADQGGQQAHRAARFRPAGAQGQGGRLVHPQGLLRPQAREPGDLRPGPGESARRPAAHAQHPAHQGGHPRAHHLPAGQHGLPLLRRVPQHPGAVPLHPDRPAARHPGGLVARQEVQLHGLPLSSRWARNPC